MRCWDVLPKWRDKVTHVVAKGGSEELVAEVMQSTTRSAEVNMRAFKVVSDMFRKAAQKADLTPLSCEQVWDTVNKDASPGEPWAAKFPTKEDFSPQDLEELFDLEGALEQLIVERGKIPVEHHFKVHSKRDKYSAKKFANKRFRSIQGTDVILHLMMARYLKQLCTAVYDHCPHVGVKIPKHTWNEKITQRFNGKRTWGIDFTGYDKGIPANVIRMIVMELCSIVGCPTAIALHMAEAVATGAFVMPDGNIIERGGGNPSGEYLTTIVNSFYHLYMVVDVYHDVLGVDETCVLEEVDPVVCGDDGLMGGELSVAEVKEAAAQITERYGLETKVDLHDGDLYPREAGCHAPFLGQVSVMFTNGIGIPAPFEPMRTMSRGVETKPGDTEQQLLERQLGIREALGAFVVMRYCVPEYPLPTIVEEFLAELEAKREKRPDLNWSGYVQTEQLIAQLLGYQQE